MVAAAGSAVGLANIWRFPYMVGQNGGGAFILLYLVCLLLIGFPVFITEILIGKKGKGNPQESFKNLSGSTQWGMAGLMTILTGFLVSTFYSAVAGWVLGYLFEAVTNSLNFGSHADASAFYAGKVGDPLWSTLFHFIFMIFCVGVLLLGVKGGIERSNKIMMPLLLIILIGLVVHGFMLPSGFEALSFLLTPDWSLLTPAAVLAALGHSFFTLSLGQGTMVTYGSYIDEKAPLVSTCIPVAIFDTLISLLAALAIFSIAFSQGIQPDSGPGLLFQTLPLAFAQMPGGFWVAILFFLLVAMAAITSEISAMEPSIAWLKETWNWSRHKATLAVGGFGFLIGMPSALSAAFGIPFLEFMDFLCSAILIPLGGLAAVILLGWIHRVTIDQSMSSGSKWYFWLTIKFTAPVLILFVFLNALGIL